MRSLMFLRGLMLAAALTGSVGTVGAQDAKAPDKSSSDGGGGGGGEVKSNVKGDLPESYAERAATFALGEFFHLGPDPDVGVIKEVVVSRPKLVKVISGPRKTTAELTATALGVVQVSLVGATGRVRTYVIRIAPNIEYIREKVSRQFPLANVRLTPAGDNILLVDGTVDAPGEVQPIIEFVRGFVGKDGTVLNGIKVGGVMQVQLQVCIAKVDREALRALRTSFLRSDVGSFAGLPQPGGLIPVPAINARGGMAGIAGNGNNVFPNLASTTSNFMNAPIDPTATAFFGITQVSSAFFGALEALKEESLAKILATPTLVTLNGRPADFLVGGETPVPQLSGGGGILTPSIEYRAFGTRLTFVPVVLGEGKIRLNVIPEVSTIVENAGTLQGFPIPRFNTQRLNTTVEMETGQTLALGGLLQTEEEAVVTKIPLLGDLPWIGALFRRVRHRKREQELLVLVTPTLVSPLRGCQVPEMLPGQETRTPNDHELFLKGRIEIPVGHPDGPLPLGLTNPAATTDLPPAPLPAAPVVPTAGRR